MSAELVDLFTPENFGEWCREKFDRFTSDLHPVADPGDFAKADIVGYVQSLPDAETNRPLLVMAVHAGANINERSSRRRQFDYARKQLQTALDTPPAKVKGLFTQGLFAFYDETGCFRLSLITGRAEGRRLVYGDFKRQSFFVAPDRENKTFRARMASPFTAWKRLVEAFSVETLTQEFYHSLFAWYERAMDPASKVSFPNDPARDDDDRHRLSEHLIRLITRLMFVWFIRQKKLVPKDLFDTGDLRHLLTRFDPLSPTQDNYYRAILQNLFFATLNCEIGDRAFAREGSFQENKEHFGIKLLYRYRDEFACPTDQVIERFRTVPFLNGGLFECLDKQTDYQDGFSRNPKRRAHIPNRLFFDDAGLITLFARYDFTVDENSPNDADVALDPELLGKVFENLLGAYNPETQQTARKQSGSFYTPREIVNYMVDESLVAHLRTKVPEAEEAAIRALLDQEDPPPLSAPLRRALVEALYRCRILDPACGSGAFPMGVLLKMVHLLQRLDPNNALWHEIVMAETERDLAEAETLSAAEKAERRRRITESFDQSVNAPDYARKLYLIENGIYGVDIQSIAVQIAKLRAFITLVCDQTPTADAAKNYGMLPLPNLETKFVAANTLIGLATGFADGLKTADGASLLNDPELHRLRAELAEVRHRHFRARNAPEKNQCRKRDDELRGRIRARLVEIASKPNAGKLALWQAEIGKLQQQRKGVEKEAWREVVQTPATQGEMFETTPKPVQTTLRTDVNKERRDKIDADIRRLTRDIEAERNRARNKSAFQHEADRLAAWDPYDQNASSPFFDPEWMFDVNDGFDIVIGNPPYVRIQTLPTEDVAAFKQRYVAAGKGNYDLYVVFVERSVQLLTPRGQLAFILPHKFFNAQYGEPLRRLLAAGRHLRHVVHFGDQQIFPGATNYVCLLFLSQAGADACRWVRVDDLPAWLGTFRAPETDLPAARFTPAEWNFAVGPSAGLFEKLQQMPVKLGTLAERISQGIRTSANEVYVLNVVAEGGALVTAFSKHLEKEVAIERTAVSRFLAGREIKAYSIQSSGKVVLIPYEIRAGRALLIPIGEFAARFPKAEAYIQANRRYLAAREGGRMPGVGWHGFIYPKNLEVMRSPKLLVPDISDRAAFAYDDRGDFAFTSGYGITFLPAVKESPKYVLGLLNSRLLDWYWKRVSTPLRGGFFRYFAQFIEQLPIRPIDFGLPSDRAEHDALAGLADRILAAKAADPLADTSSLEREIDERVYRLYGLTPDEIAIVEGRDSGAKKAAAAAKPVKAAAGAKKPRKSVLTEDPDLA